jgi:hypothetical protein
MISREEARRAFGLALETFAKPWTLAADLTEVTIRDPGHWLSGIHTFRTTLRHPTTGALKVLGRRNGTPADATYHRGVSGLVLQAYLEGAADPIRRYLEEIEVISAPTPRLTPLRRS